MSARFQDDLKDITWGMSPHHDGSAGMLLLAYQLVGDRELWLQAAGGDVKVPCSPGHVYMANIATMYHQVRHQFGESLLTLGPLGRR